MPSPKGKKYNKNIPDLNTKVAKYYFAKKTGMSAAKATEVAGYSAPNQSSVIEKSKSYKVLQKYYRDELQDQISIKQIAGEHRKVIMQDEQLGPKIAAIKIAMDSIEPTPPKEDDDSDKVFVVLR